MYEWQGMETMEAADLVSQRDPREYPWGVFGSDHVAAAGGGVGVLLWFASAAELLDFSVEVEPRVLLGDDDPDLATFQSRLRAVREAAKDPATLTDQLRTEFNDAMRGVSEYQWWGHFADLCEGSSEFARSLRSDLRDEEGPDADKPILPEEIQRFVEHISDYGH